MANSLSLAGWPKAMKNDKQAILTAATPAQRTNDFLDSLRVSARDVVLKSTAASKA